MGIYIFGLQSKISYSLLSNLTYKISSDQNTVKRLETGRKSAPKGGWFVSKHPGLWNGGLGVCPCSLRRVFSEKGLSLYNNLKGLRLFRGICNQCFNGKSSSFCYHASTYSWEFNSSFFSESLLCDQYYAKSQRYRLDLCKRHGGTSLTTVYQVPTSASGTYILGVQKYLLGE